MKYKIKQIRHHNDYRFMDYDYAIKHGFSLDDYKVMYEGEMIGNNVNRILNDLFAIFNVHRPKDFEGHSLSTSDIVELDGVNYYCDWIGWKKLD